jgi:hypothetical protein
VRFALQQDTTMVHHFNGKITGPRYVMKFTNGLHIIFDRLNFEVAEVFRTRKLMEEKYNKE